MELGEIFGNKIANGLGRAGIKTLDDLIESWSDIEKDFRSIRNLGPTSYAVVEYFLKVELP